MINIWLNVIRMVTLWASRWRWRRDLAQFDDRMLRDIGLTRPQARLMVEKRFWEE